MESIQTPPRQGLRLSSSSVAQNDRASPRQPGPKLFCQHRISGRSELIRYAAKRRCNNDVRGHRSAADVDCSSGEIMCEPRFIILKRDSHASRDPDFPPLWFCVEGPFARVAEVLLRLRCKRPIILTDKFLLSVGLAKSVA